MAQGPMKDPVLYAKMLEELGSVTLPSVTEGQPVVPQAISAPAAPGLQQQAQAVSERARQAISAPGSSVKPSAQPELGTYLADPKQAEGSNSFINDPRTIAATVFGLAALNSDADSLAGAFLEGLGALGSAQGAQRERLQQEFQNRTTEEKARQQQEQIDIARFSAEQTASQGAARTQLAAAGLDMQAFELGLKERGLDLESLNQQDRNRVAQANIALGNQSNKAKILAALLGYEADTARTAAIEKGDALRTTATGKDRDTTLKVALMKLLAPDDPYGLLTQEQKQQHATQTAKLLEQHFPFLKGLITEQTLAAEKNDPATVSNQPANRTPETNMTEALKALGTTPSSQPPMDAVMHTLKEEGFSAEDIASTTDAHRLMTLSELGYRWDAGSNKLTKEKRQENKKTKSGSDILAALRARTGTPEAQAATNVTEVDVTDARKTLLENSGFKPGDIVVLSDGSKWQWTTDNKLRAVNE